MMFVPEAEKHLGIVVEEMGNGLVRLCGGVVGENDEEVIERAAAIATGNKIILLRGPIIQIVRDTKPFSETGYRTREEVARTRTRPAPAPT